MEETACGGSPGTGVDSPSNALACAEPSEGFEAFGRAPCGVATAPLDVAAVFVAVRDLAVSVHVMVVYPS